MGRSRGGLTTGIHAVVDANGLPLRVALSPGRRHDSQTARILLEDRLPPDSFVPGDTACDAERIGAAIEAREAVAIIPDRSTANAPHPFSPVLYRLRNRVERFFNELKHFRRVAARYEILAANFLATIRLWLRLYESTTRFPAQAGDILTLPIRAADRGRTADEERSSGPGSRSACCCDG